MCRRRSKRILNLKSALVPDSVQPRCRLTKINDELDDLQTSDPFFPPYTNSARALKVVPVHDNVHQ